MKKLITICLAVVGLVVSGTGVASAGPLTPYGGYQATRCWVSFDHPKMQGKSLVVGEASLSCVNGYHFKGVPNLRERVVKMEIEAVLRYWNPKKQAWQNRGEFNSKAASSAQTLRVPLSAVCAPTLPTASGEWQVHVTYAYAEEAVPDYQGVNGGAPDQPHTWYGVSGRSAELPCA